MTYHRWSGTGGLSYGGQPVGQQMVGPRIGSADQPDLPDIIDTTRPDNADADAFYANASGQRTSGYTIGPTAILLPWPFPPFTVQDIST